MISPLPLFTLREWGSVREEGHICPLCATGKLGFDTEGNQFLCNHCGEPQPIGWRRYHFAHDRPSQVGRDMDTRKGPLFATVQHYLRRPGMEEENPYHLADLTIDIDFESDLPRALDTARTISGYLTEVNAYHQVFFSGSKGFHIEIPWQVVGAMPSSELHHRTYRTLVKNLAKDLGVEVCMHVYTRARMFRVENTLHPKTGLFKVRLTLEQLAGELPEILQLAAHPQEDTPRNPEDNLSVPNQLWLSEELHKRYSAALHTIDEEPEAPRTKLTATYEVLTHPACIQQAFAEGPPSGGTRHSLTMNLAAYWASISAPAETVLDWAKDTPGASDTPSAQRVREAGHALRWAERNRPAFRCEVMQEMGLCDPECPFFNPMKYA